MRSWLTVGLGILASAALITASLFELPVEITLLEAIAVVTCAWSVWLLAENRPLGWWIGLIGVAAYAAVFYRVRLYAEVGIQVFYFATSVQAIYLWLRGGAQGGERPVSAVPGRAVWITAILVPVAVLALRAVLIEIRGAAPFWDALTTVLSLTAHLYLMGRYVESWYLWVAVDVIYIPLYASRELFVTSALYAVFLVMAVYGLCNFRRLYELQQQATEPAV